MAAEKKNLLAPEPGETTAPGEYDKGIDEEPTQEEIAAWEEKKRREAQERADDEQIKKNLYNARYAQKAAGGSRAVVDSARETPEQVEKKPDISPDVVVEFNDRMGSRLGGYVAGLPDAAKNGIYQAYINAEDAKSYTELREKIHKMYGNEIESVNKNISTLNKTMIEIARLKHNESMAAQGDFGRMANEDGDLVFMTEREKAELRKNLEPSDALRSWLAENEPDKYRAPELHMAKKTAMAEQFANALSMALSGLGGSEATLQAAKSTLGATGERLQGERMLNEAQKQKVDERNFKVFQQYRQNIIAAEAAMDKASNESAKTYIRQKQATLARKQAAFFGILQAKGKLQQIRNNLIVSRSANARSIEESKELTDRFNISNKLKAEIASKEMRQRASIANARNKMSLYRTYATLKKMRSSKMLRSALGVRGEERLEDASAALNVYGVGNTFHSAAGSMINDQATQVIAQENSEYINEVSGNAVQAITTYAKDKTDDSDKEIDLTSRMMRNYMRASRAGIILDPNNETVIDQLSRENMFKAGSIRGDRSKATGIGADVKMSRDVMRKLQGSNGILRVAGQNPQNAKQAEAIKRKFGNAIAVRFGLGMAGRVNRERVRKLKETD